MKLFNLKLIYTLAYFFLIGASIVALLNRQGLTAKLSTIFFCLLLLGVVVYIFETKIEQSK
jgi:hypothetical protein